MKKMLIDVELVRALYNYSPSEQGRLAFHTGDLILVVQKLETGWWDGIVDSKRGWFPSNFVSIPETAKIRPRKSYGWVRRKTRNDLRIYHNLLTGDTITVEDGSEGDLCDDSSDDDDHSTAATNATLPLHWGHKITSDGRNYYYNMLTNETTWNITDIDLQSGKLKTRSLHTSPKNMVLELDDLNRTPTTEWEKLRLNVFMQIQNLKRLTANRDKSKYLEAASNIVQAVQYMFLSADTLEKDSQVLKSNKMLGIHHRHILKSLSKLVLSSKQAAGIWPPPDAPALMCNDVNEVLLAVRHFTSAAEELGLSTRPSSYFDGQPGEDPSLMSNIDESTSSLNIISSLEAYPKKISDEIVELHKYVCNNNGEFPQNNLIVLTRNIVTEVGQFLSAVEEINLKSSREDIVSDFERNKESLYNAIRSLVSAATSAVGPLPNVDSLDQIILFSSSVESAVNDLMLSAKYIAEDEENNERSFLADRNYNESEEHSPSELSLEPRRALSMNHLVTGDEYSDPDRIRLSSTSDIDLSKSFEKNGVSRSLSKLRIFDKVVHSSPVSPVGNDSTKSSSYDNSNHLKYKPRSVSSSAPIPRRVTVSSTKKSKLSRIFGSDIMNKTSETPHETEWFLGFDHDPKDLILSIDGNVKGATLPALMEKMTYHDSYDTNLTQAFLLTYRTFTTAPEFLQLLIDRFTITPPEGLTEDQHIMWFENKLKPIRLRVFNIIKTWLDSYFMEDDLDLIDDLQDFAVHIVKDPMPLASDQLMKLIERRRNYVSKSKKVVPVISKENAPPPILPRNLKRLRFIDIDPLEMARQITILESRLYCGITAAECLGKAWSDKETNRAPTIKAMIETTNQITGWVAENILLEKDIKKRCSIMKYFILVGDKCRQINNFNALMAILAALNSSPIHRLKRTKELLSSKTRALVEDLKKLMAPGQNFLNYRHQLRTVNPPCVPFLGMYLTDLTFIEDGNGDYVKSVPHLINFDKRMKTAEKIREIQQYQMQYELVEVNEIQKFLTTSIAACKKDADELYQRSLQIEPREREDEKIARLLQESGFL